MAKQFDYKGAKSAGYSDEEIMNHLSEINNFDSQSAINSGYSPEEINEYLSNYQPKKSKLEKAARIGTQYALGTLENVLLPYELGVAPLAQKESQIVKYRENVMEDIERLMEQKQTGVWDQKDQELLDHLTDQIKNPEKAEQFIKTSDIGIRSLAEKATGLDLKPEGILEKAANWSGFIKNPKNIAKIGMKSKDFIKAISPTGTEALRGLSAGTALQMAEQNDFGPIGSMAAAIVGDVVGGKVGNIAKTAKQFVLAPKETLAKGVAKLTPKDKLDIQKNIINDFRSANISADLGTITDSNLIKWTQSRLSQSGLVGKSLDEFRQNLTNQIKTQYKSLADQLGVAKFATSHEAGESLKNTLTAIREADLNEARKLYSSADRALKGERNFVDPTNLANKILSIEKQLKPGAIKSGEQKVVLDALNTLKRDVFDSSGKMMFSDVKDLINNKIALNDIINYEIQGGAKQLLKGIVNELDRVIISYKKQNPTFAKQYIAANKKFSEHAKTFRNRKMEHLLKSDPEQIFNQLNTIEGIRRIKDVLMKTKEGKELFENLKRLKFDQIVGNNLVDSTTQQIKLGTFSKLLEKGLKRDIIKEIMDPGAYGRLINLQKNAGHLADSANKFYNASKSGVVAADAAVLAKVLHDISNLVVGNPWPLAKTAGGIVAAKQLSKLLSDLKFLSLVEQAILSTKKQSTKQMSNVLEKMRPYLLLLKESEKD